jgi:membrane-bound serine protease (ClpP class)
MEYRFWAVVCCGLMAVFVILELFTPSMGGFTILALGAAVGSAYLGFQYSEPFGYLMVAANLTTFPVVLYFGLNLLKKSPIMHHHELLSGSQSSPDAPPLSHLLGKEGRTVTPLRPAGSAMIGEAKVDVVAQGKFVDPGTPIRVIHVEGNRVVVEPI